MRRKNILIIISLLISLFIYVFYRTEKTLVIKMLLYTVSPQNYLYVREAVNYYLPLHSTIIYSLPEGLWVFCITLTSQYFFVSIWNRRISGVFIPLIFCIGLEIFQLLNFTNGRFDFLDIGVSLFFWIIAFFFFRNKSEKENVLKKINVKRVLCFCSYGIVYLAHVTE